MAFQEPRDGYGYAGISIGKALRELAPETALVNMMDGYSLERFPKPGECSWTVDGPAVALCLPNWWPYIECERVAGWTMCESTKLPAGRVAGANAAAEVVLTPCEFCAEVYEAEGVRAPIEVVPFGVDPDVYFPLERAPHDGPYTFLWDGTPDFRKGWDVAYRAFLQAFGRSKDVHLVLRFRKRPRGVLGFDDENVTMVYGLMDRAALRRLYHEADCFVYPARGEGWGLPPREAAATGLPVLATDWGGLKVEIENWAYPIEVAGLSPAQFGLWDATELGEWAEPDVEHVAELMRWCEQNREEAAAKGWRAARWIREFGTWRRTAERLLEILGWYWRGERRC